MSNTFLIKILPIGCLTLLVGMVSFVRTKVTSDVAAAAITSTMDSLPVDGPKQNATATMPDLSGLPELSLNDLIKRPVGPQGLELSDHVKSLDGKCIKVTGFMVHTDWADPSTFILADYPSNISEREFGPSDDLAPVQLYVKLPASMKTGFQRGVLQLAGRLRLGSAEEPYNRRSFLRLEVDTDVSQWHVSLKAISAWTEETRQQYQTLTALQRRISCGNCAVPTTAMAQAQAQPQTTPFVSPTATIINPRKNKL